MVQEVRDNWGIAPGGTSLHVPVSTSGNRDSLLTPPHKISCLPSQGLTIALGVSLQIGWNSPCWAAAELMLCVGPSSRAQPGRKSSMRSMGDKMLAASFLCWLKLLDLPTQSNGEQQRYCSYPMKVLTQSLGEEVKIPLHQKLRRFKQQRGVAQHEDGSAQLVNVHGT